MQIPDWLRQAVFYQIYPQSFYDSNNDGIGDLEGIGQKLDYIAGLGCNAIWLNPCFESPFLDAGYDVADYCKVAPRYGSNADLRRLVKAAAKKGIRICLDLVVTHTSIEHPWFQESCKPEQNEYTHRFIWTESVWRNTDPNYRFINGYSQRDGNYLASFFWSQPALNYGFAKPDPSKPWQLPSDHAEVKKTQAAVVDIMRYWLDMGVSGFRIDMASALVKGDEPGKWPCTSRIWREIFDQVTPGYPEAVFIAEASYPAVFVPKAGFHADFTLGFDGTGDYQSLLRKEDFRDAFGFFGNGPSFFDKKGQGDITHFLESYMKHYRACRGKGYVSVPTGNHDVTRIGLGRSAKELEVIHAFVLTMPGLPVIYYGDEIGMTHLDLPSKEGGYKRTGARTPMQWRQGRNMGFSKAAAAKLYLPVDPSKRAPTVADQEAKPRSLLNRVRQLIQLRQENPALSNDAAFEPLYAKKNKYPFVYLRRQGRQRFLVALNPAGREETVTIPLPKADKAELVMGHDSQLTPRGQKAKLTCPPISYSIYRL